MVWNFRVPEFPQRPREPGAWALPGILLKRWEPETLVPVKRGW